MRKSMSALMLGMSLAMMGGMSGPEMSYREPWRDRRKPKPKKYLLPTQRPEIAKGHKVEIITFELKNFGGKNFLYNAPVAFGSKKALTKKIAKLQSDFEMAIGHNENEWLKEQGVIITDIEITNE